MQVLLGCKGCTHCVPQSALLQHWVRNSVMSVAYAISQVWPIMFEGLKAHFITDGATPPLLFWTKLKADDSEQRLALDVCNGVLHRDQRIAKWEICVQERSLGRGVACSLLIKSHDSHPVC